MVGRKDLMAKSSSNASNTSSGVTNTQGNNSMNNNNQNTNLFSVIASAFSKKSDTVVASTFVSSNNSPVAQNKENTTVNTTNNTPKTVAQFAIDNTTVYAAREFKLSFVSTKEQIEALSVRGTFYSLIQAGRIGFTRAANETRKNGKPVTFYNKLQADQWGRAFAAIFIELHGVNGRAVIVNNDGVIVGGEYALYDKNGGSQDRYVTLSVNAQGYVDYEVNYGHRVFNHINGQTCLNKGAFHAINQTVQQRAADYNSWVNAHNEAVRARAMGTATPEQLSLLSKAQSWNTENLNEAVRDNVVRGINGDAIMNKYAIELLLLLNATTPAFEIYHSCKDEASMGRFLDLIVKNMEHAFRSELMKFAGLRTFNENTDGTTKAE